MGKIKVARIAVSAATFHIDKPYDYKIPHSLESAAVPGVRVSLPFGRGNRRTEGIILSLGEREDSKTLKNIDTVLDDEPVLTEEQLRLCMWMNDRFFCTVYSAARSMLPAGMWFKDGIRKTSDKKVNYVSLCVPSEDAMAAADKKKKSAPVQAAILTALLHTDELTMQDITYLTGGTLQTVRSLEKQGYVRVEKREVFRRPSVDVAASAPDIRLNSGQQTAYEGLCTLAASECAEAALLYGVTGSGKTSVYIKLIESVLELGKTAIVLVPEISLTPQLMGIFVSYFGESIAVLHSALGIGERYDEWKRIKRGDVKVVVGTRSAVFAPLENLGVIVLDEEQEHTYKSENSPRYHARDVAKYRCSQSNALLLLGSATPSVESMYYASTGRYKLFRLHERFNRMDLPEVVIADMKQEIKDGNGTSISSVLRREIEKNISCGEQSILFINRRGASSLIACPECGYTYNCEYCSVSLTHHSANGRMMCHYCGYSLPLADICPSCGGRLKHVGTGTQRLEQELLDLFPDTGIIRMDADTVGRINAHEELLHRFRTEKTPILLGTQMVAKGLDFENVTLVGVISADLSLYVNDYRAHERTFSLITQVVGRSGRGKKSGRAVIQTFTPENEVIRLAAAQDYDTFYEREIELRGIMECPPLKDLLTITVTGLDETAVIAGSAKLRSTLCGYFSARDDIKVLGPAPAVVTKINNKYRYRVTVMAQNDKTVRNTIAHSIKEFSRDSSLRGLSAYADIDPLD